MEKSWKRFEREIAKQLNASRRLEKGRSVDDITYDYMHVDCKIRKKFAIWSLFRETQAKYGKDGKPVVLVIREGGKRGALVVMDFRDFKSLLAKAGLLEVNNGEAESVYCRDACFDDYVGSGG